MNTTDQLTSMNQPTSTPDTTLSAETIDLLRLVPILATLDEAGLHCLDGSTDYWAQQDELIVEQGAVSNTFWILLEGSIRLYHVDPSGEDETYWVYQPGTSFGEVPLLAGLPATANCRAAERSHLLKLNEERFWSLMTRCPGVRKAVLGNMAMRLAKAQQATFHQEKMAALGTLAAGLMHELNNPGSAARRASTQLRDNLMRMQRLSSKFSQITLTPEQKVCLHDLQEMAFTAKPTSSMNSLEQSDAEEALAEWMESASIEDAWRIAPTLVSIGMDARELGCARQSFGGEVFSDCILWLEALVSSMQLVGTIEESIGRVTELVGAVKSYAYESRGKTQSVDVNRSILATLVIVGHKLREKQITLEKDLARQLPELVSDCGGLNQIWTNLLDNAIDAAPQGGRIGLKTWVDNDELCILVSDNGSGIPAESQTRVFDPFYTTKPVGVGTGMGLGIVQRIVEQFGGSIRFSSMPGETEFVVRLPSKRK